MKKILFLLICLFGSSVSVLSYGTCDYFEISRMKSLVTNINLSYDYKIIDNEVYFDVTLNNLTNDIYFYDTVTQKNYYYSDTINGEITITNYKTNSGSYKFYSNASGCYGNSLGTKYYEFPVYNKYYNDPLCQDIPNYSLCQKWGYVSYSYDEFEKMVNEYKTVIPDEEEKNVVEHKKTFLEKLVDIYIDYYYYFLGGLILLCSVVIVINNKKNSFKL